jgi:hypothetical protein
MEYLRRTSQEILEVRKKYTQFIYYHCVDIYIYIYIFAFIRIEDRMEEAKGPAM